MTSLDPRRHPFKADIAAASLKGQVDAQQFAQGTDHTVRAFVTDILDAPGGQVRTSQALFGERFTVYQTADGFAWGQLATDGYVGWVEEGALAGASSTAPTHRVVVPLTRATDATIKSIGAGPLPMGAQLCAAPETVAMGATSAPFRVTDAGPLPAKHLLGMLERVDDWVAAAEAFVGVPYVWGGRSALGLDCSALVQLALQAGGIWWPRDSDMQEAELGEPVPVGAPLARGDLLFWPGHVGIVTGTDTLLHANAFAMSTVHEPLADAEARMGARRTVRRLSP
ncbi:MAG: C40 family peptidase [Devosiaceae bacterium]|nr:C40 family peptidase [Devosiaceae bacterium MH13]